jgi:hypothetical protein
MLLAALYLPHHGKDRGRSSLSTLAVLRRPLSALQLQHFICDPYLQPHVVPRRRRASNYTAVPCWPVTSDIIDHIGPKHGLSEPLRASVKSSTAKRPSHYRRNRPPSASEVAPHSLSP